MTREEERKEASIEYRMSKSPIALGGDNFADIIREMNVDCSFIEGARWADKTMIENVYKWLENHAATYFIPEKQMLDVDKLIKDLQKAMEE